MVRPTPTPYDKQIRFDGRIVRWLMAIVARVRLPPVVEVSADRPTILAGNHQSLLDIFLAAAACNNAGLSARFLVQASYFDQPAGRWLRRIGCIPLNSKTKERAFAEAAEALERHEVIGIMPEGRLVAPDERDGQTGPFRAGVAELARATGAEVRPIAFHDTGTVWPRGGWPRLRLRRPTVTLEIGDEPIELHHENDQANADEVRRSVNSLLDTLDARRG